ncbi:class I SAM-dependent RNA methyltransferase [bacterium]|nr:class I SAM-dependent RNA methyltransferase [candidate division CSSED10-310 bacterium]
MRPIDEEEMLNKLREKLGPAKKQDDRAELERLFGKRAMSDEDRLRAKLVKPSIQVGDTVDLTIERIAFGGEGIGKIGTATVFVPDVVPGDTASVKITRINHDVYRGDVVEMRARSSNRVQPRCPLFGICGGCQLQSLVYTAQLKAKEEMAADVLKRIGNIETRVRSLISSPDAFGYRLRTRVHVRTDGGRVTIGYFARRSNELVPLTQCPLLVPALNSIITALPNALPAPGTAPLPTEIALQCDAEGSHATVHMIGSEPILYTGLVSERLQTAGCPVIGVSALAGGESSKAGHTSIRHDIGTIPLTISSDSFIQANRYLLRKFIDQAIMLSSPATGDHLLDLYCGSGFFSLAMARFVASATGCDLSGTAISDATDTAAAMGLSNTHFIACDENRFFKHPDITGKPFSLVIADPPRSGLSVDVLKNITALKPAKLLMISCDPATLARDLKALTEADFRIRVIQPIDMFPHTYHLENMVFLTHRYTGTQAANQAFPDFR